MRRKKLVESSERYYYYYHVAFNAPCIGHKDDESLWNGDITEDDE